MAVDLAQHFHAELFLLNVIPMFSTTSLPDMVPETDFIHGILGAPSCEVPSGSCGQGIRATPSVEVGNDVAGNVMEVIEREHIDMVVVSTQGISGWHPRAFGSIVEKVVKLVECLLLLLRSAKPESGVKTGAGGAMEGW